MTLKKILLKRSTEDKMDKIIAGLQLLLCNLNMLFYKIIYLGNISLPIKNLSTHAPQIRIRNNGRLNLKNVKFRSGNFIFCDGGELNIGDGCFFNRNCSINCVLNIKIGKNTIFGENVKIYDHNHDFSSEYIVSLTQMSSDNISIGSNCWIGTNVIILKGVTITNNVIISAGSIITKDILFPGVYTTSKLALRKIK